MARPNLSLVVAIDTGTGETFVSLQAVVELEAAVEILESNLQEIRDCLAKIKRERERLEEEWNGGLQRSLG